MNQVIPNDSRYIPLTQQKWCCVPTCIQIVMLRQSIPLVPSELIGHYMGLVVPDDARKYFWEARTGTKPPAGFGTQVSNPKYNPNAVFRNLKIPLKMNWSLINKFKNKNEFKEYLREIRAMAIDMETATIFSVGFHNEIPVGALLLVSDQPMIPEGVKTEESDKKVTTDFVTDHLRIGIDSLKELQKAGISVKHLKF